MKTKNTPKVALHKEKPKIKKVRKSSSLTAEQEASGPYLSALKALQSNKKTKKASPANQNE